jgi:hypothetical protein
MNFYICFFFSLFLQFQFQFCSWFLFFFTNFLFWFGSLISFLLIFWFFEFNFCKREARGLNDFFPFFLLKVSLELETPKPVLLSLSKLFQLFSFSTSPFRYNKQTNNNLFFFLSYFGTCFICFQLFRFFCPFIFLDMFHLQ